MELAVSSSDPIHREEHRLIAVWIGEFMHPETGIEGYLRNEHKALTAKADPGDDDRPYMPSDSGTAGVTEQ